MSVKVKEFHAIIEKVAPSVLKEKYDNVGLMIGDMEQHIGNILVAMDCTMEVIEEAVEKGCNFVFTHHPLLFIKPATITNETLKGKKILKLIKNDIALYSAHTNLDSAFNGINDYAAKIIGYESIEVMDKSKINGFQEDSGIGRILELKETIVLKDLCEKVKELYSSKTLKYSGNEKWKIKRVALINGSGQDYFSLAKDMGADCIITGDTTYHFVSDLIEEGIAVIDPGHFDTEWSAFKIVVNNLEGKLRNIGFNGNIIFSETCRNPYKVL